MAGVSLGRERDNLVRVQISKACKTAVTWHAFDDVIAYVPFWQ